MLLLKERAIYQVCKLYIEFVNKSEVTMYKLQAQTLAKEEITLYAHQSKSVIDFIFDGILAELKSDSHKVIDTNYIIKNACE